MSIQEKRLSRKAEMFHLIQEQLKSGLSQVQFCKHQKMSIATFGYWRKQYRMEKPPEKNQTLPPHFVPLQIKTRTPAAQPLEIQLPNQIIVRCPDWRLEQLPELITKLQKM